ncbi:hypothetical protein UFOVP121_2 [uncultured Caudovirales phage]|uniref:Uncharacterized protein n=1 Tax=uncultured Caudovirales phage TaxID=2100421 RepID=A0A6J5LJF4_9CAUD|nr:hypothetical protein UFOVP121_2 [uncultured Caudovirales phage]CAB4134738.1 hypothetical protein UFOVP277_7 [uncultured Caudovirales phage]
MAAKHVTTIELTNEQIQSILGKTQKEYQKALELAHTAFAAKIKAQQQRADRRVERHVQTAQSWKVRYYDTYKALKAARVENHDLKKRLREGKWE